MKRRLQRINVETDEQLTFCRSMALPLVEDSAAVGELQFLDFRYLRNTFFVFLQPRIPGKEDPAFG